MNPVSVTELSGYTDITATVNTAITGQSPTVTPSGATGTYAIAPTLPAGLSLDTSTGTITGTPSEVSASETYTITFTAGGNYTGTASQEITIVIPDAPPGAPTIGIPIAGDAQVTVSWAAPTDTGYNGGVVATITGYTVYYGANQGFTKDNAEGSKNAGATDTEIVVDGLTIGTTYHFLVTATNATGEGAVFSSASAYVPLTSETLRGVHYRGGLWVAIGVGDTIRTSLEPGYPEGQKPAIVPWHERCVAESITHKL